MIVLFFIALTLCVSCDTRVADEKNPPYPASPVIEKLVCDLDNIVRKASGSDLWPITWADDDNVYTAWGDGGGFEGTNSKHRVLLGVAKVVGAPKDFVGSKVDHGGKLGVGYIGKPTGMLSVDGVLYMWVTEEGTWVRTRLARSKDHGASWNFSDWFFGTPEISFCDPTFLNFGKDYQNSRDQYVYFYGADGRNGGQSGPKFASDVLLGRVPKDKIVNRSAYEFFNGFDGTGKPIWTSDVMQSRAVFSNPSADAGTGWAFRVDYNQGIKRYLMTRFHQNGSLGIFDGPEPWGPWSTVYYGTWLGGKLTFGHSFPSKWQSTDGRKMYIIFSGTGTNDAFCLAECYISLKSEG